MNGIVDPTGKALLELGVQLFPSKKVHLVEAWIDTAFDGALVFPQILIQKLDLKQTAAISAMLADGSEVILNTYECWINWLGQTKKVEVVANNGKYPLLGIELLRGCLLTVDYLNAVLTIK